MKQSRAEIYELARIAEKQHIWSDLRPNTRNYRNIEMSNSNPGGTPLLGGLAERIRKLSEGGKTPDILEAMKVLEDVQLLATSTIPNGIAVRVMGEPNTYTVLKDGHWLANVRMNGEMSDLQQVALIQAIMSGRT
jgi:hypothetical protein